MKYQAYKSFGYPVLSPATAQEVVDADYVGYNFEPSFDPTIPPDAPNIILIEVELYSLIPAIRLAVTQQKAEAVLLVSCRTTFSSKCYPIGAEESSVRVEADNLSDKVELSVFIIAKETVKIEDASINEEFGYKQFEVQPGEILAQSATDQFSVHKEFYRNPRSIISLNVNKDLNDGEYFLSLDNSYIEVSTGTKLNKIINGLSTSKYGKTYALNSFYVPVIAQALNTLHDRPDLEEYKWAQVLKDTLQTIRSDDWDQIEPHNAAQSLFRSPLLNVSMEET
mgnify:CR=1 FL=1